MKRDVTLRADPVRVWAALTDPARLSSWFGAEVDIDARPGGRARFSWRTGVARDAVVEVCEPHRYLVLRWLPFERLPDGTVSQREATAVRFLLVPVPGGTRLTVTESTTTGERHHSPTLAPEAHRRAPRVQEVGS